MKNMSLGELCLILLVVQKASSYQVNLFNSKTLQSVTFMDHNASFAVDKNPETCSITEVEPSSEENPWWRLELDRIYNITDVDIQVLSHRYAEFVNYLNVYVSARFFNYREYICASIKTPTKINMEYINIKCENPIFGKFIIIERYRGPKKTMLILCEVRLIADLKSINLAYNRPTKQIGVFFKSKATFSVDQNFSTCAVIRSLRSNFAWWRVILERSYYITDVIIYFKPNLKEEYRRKFFFIYVSNNEEYFEEHMCALVELPNNKVDERSSINRTCSRPILGTYVTIRKYSGGRPRWLILCEVQVFSKSKPREMDTDQVSTGCHDHEYKCIGGQCIHKDYLCDGTEDCEQGDDEAMSCYEACRADEFKCARWRKCISKDLKCDGSANCPDMSDEQGCFEIERDTNLLTATIKGESDFYVCSWIWELKHSFQVCSQFDGHHLETQHVPIHDTNSKFITLKRLKIFNNFLDMAHFQIKSTCRSGKFVQIQCVLRSSNGSADICGTRGYPDGDFEPYIINGVFAKNGAWPWYAQIFIDGYYVCGGSIVKRNWILTSAHCFLRRDFSSIYVKVGTNMRNDPEEMALPVSHLVSHPYFVKSSRHDVALIRLKSPLAFTKLVRPICLPKKTLDERAYASFRHCLTVGGGKSDRKGARPKYLQQGRLNLMKKEQCINHSAELLNISRINVTNMFAYKFCAGSIPTPDGINICDGDSGGPLMCRNIRRIWTLIGISTSALIIKSINMPCTMSLFTKVDNYLPFINKVFQQEMTATHEIGRASATIIIPVTYIVMWCYIVSLIKSFCSMS